jgi:hypothetical protein
MRTVAALTAKLLAASPSKSASRSLFLITLFYTVEWPHRFGQFDNRDLSFMGLKAKKVPPEYPRAIEPKKI